MRLVRRYQEWRTRRYMRAAGAEDDPMMLRHADGTPYMNANDYWTQRTDGGTRAPRLNYGGLEKYSGAEEDPDLMEGR